ncbi:MAG: sigma-70 family RNA polymerase sigma factor [Rhizobiaceae bacterium]
MFSSFWIGEPGLMPGHEGYPRRHAFGCSGTKKLWLHPFRHFACRLPGMTDMTFAATDDDDCDRLLQKVGGGDREALGALFQREAGRLIAVARRIVRRREIAEEVVQESFVAAWRHAARFDPARGRARAWLSTIVRNRALNVIRDGGRLDFADENTLAEYRNRADEAEAAFDMLGEGEALKRCLDSLEPLRRRSILLSYVVGYSHGEIASELTVPVGTVKAWIRRGVVALQECLS